jgi:hypothetical protein
MCDVQVKAMRVGTISLYTKVSLSALARFQEPRVKWSV